LVSGTAIGVPASQREAKGEQQAQERKARILEFGYRHIARFGPQPSSTPTPQLPGREHRQPKRRSSSPRVNVCEDTTHLYMHRVFCIGIFNRLEFDAPTVHIPRLLGRRIGAPASEFNQAF
jgi:hypothetical protein